MSLSLSLMFKLTIFIFIIGMVLTSSTEWINDDGGGGSGGGDGVDGDGQVLYTLSSIAQHKTFTHFKIVYNFISLALTDTVFQTHIVCRSVISLFCSIHIGFCGIPFDFCRLDGVVVFSVVRVAPSSVLLL